VADTGGARNVALEAAVVIWQRADVPAFDAMRQEGGALLGSFVYEDTCVCWGGAKGVALKLKFPKSAACAESFGCRLDEWRRLSVSVAWLSSQSHSVRGNLGSQVAMQDRKCAFQI
jgi:hypothetical protein